MKNPRKAKTVWRPAWRVAVCTYRDAGYQQQIISGVCRAAEEAGDWDLVLFERNSYPRLQECFAEFAPQGILIQHTGEVGGELEAGTAIWVEMNSERLPWAHAHVVVDNVAAGRKIGEFALSRGFTHVVYFGYRTSAWGRPSSWRLRGLRRGLEKSGCSLLALPDNFQSTQKPRVLEKVRQMEAWIRKGRIPLFVAVNDSLGKGLVHYLRTRGWSVPQQAAVVGFDNDELLCRLASPQLTSLDMGFERLGYQAGCELQRRRIAGRRALPHTRLVLPPGDLIPRRSTEIMVTENPRLRDAMERFLMSPASIQQSGDLAEKSGLSKRTLERHCRRSLGASPAQLIRREKIDAAKSLLRTTQLPIKEIAARTGFSCPLALRSIFQRATGQTPSQFRERKFGD
jgi:LacI family transcriptional regulator